MRRIVKKVLASPCQAHRPPMTVTVGVSGCVLVSLRVVVKVEMTRSEQEVRYIINDLINIQPLWQQTSVRADLPRLSVYLEGGC